MLFLRIFTIVALLAGATIWWLTRAVPPPATEMADLTGDATRGEQVFTAAGCADCHTAPGSKDDRLLAGGQTFVTAFGTFVAPNISPDPLDGIGGWTLVDFASALKRGVSPEGRHYYPAFPYAAYTKMADQDIADLWAFWQALPESRSPSAAHDLIFPFSIRRGIGVWKMLFFTDDWVMQDAATAELERGRYLVEALAHCGECHTPRGPMGALRRDRWLAGAANPSGSGRVPGLRPGQLAWDAEAIAYYLETGFTPDYDSAGGHMAEVVGNFAQLPAEDRAAVAAYLKALPPLPAAD